jgi:hypothetical protein
LLLDDKLENLNLVTEFVAHAVDTTLSKFWMFVDSRGLLGEQSADVLFFDKSTDVSKRLEEFRSYLLGNPDIRQAYNSIDQFPSWTPHLTLGYPETPAKSNVNRGYPGLVSFDRIALWTGDYEGVEFPLKSDAIGPLAMSALGEKFFKHYGVKGMHWGTRRNSDKGAPVSVETHIKPGRPVGAKGGNNQPPHEDAVRAAIARQKAKKSSTDSLSNKELQDLVTRMNLEQQYSRLSAANNQSSNGQQFISTLLKAGKTANDIHSFIKSPAGKAIKVALKAKLGG